MKNIHLITGMLFCLLLSGATAKAAVLSNCDDLFLQDPTHKAKRLAYETQVKRNALLEATKQFISMQIVNIAGFGNDQIMKELFVKLTGSVAFHQIEKEVFGLSEEEQEARNKIDSEINNTFFEVIKQEEELHEAIRTQLKAVTTEAIAYQDEIIKLAYLLIPITEEKMAVKLEVYLQSTLPEEQTNQLYLSQSTNRDFISAFDRWYLRASGQAFAPGFLSTPEDPSKEPALKPKLGM